MNHKHIVSGLLWLVAALLVLSCVPWFYSVECKEAARHIKRANRRARMRDLPPSIRFRFRLASVFATGAVLVEILF